MTIPKNGPIIREKFSIRNIDILRQVIFSSFMPFVPRHDNKSLILIFIDNKKALKSLNLSAFSSF